MRYAPAALAVLMAALLTAGCGRKASAPLLASGGGHILLTLLPAVPRALDLVVFTVHVTGTDNRPLAHAQVSADLSMPDMAMPPNPLSFTPSAPGAYTAQGRFSMPGRWAITVAGMDKGRRTVAVFPVTVR